MMINGDVLRGLLDEAFQARNEALQRDRTNEKHGVGYRLSEHEFSIRTIHEAIRVAEDTASIVDALLDMKKGSGQ